MQVDPTSNNLVTQDRPKRKIVLGVCSLLSEDMNLPVFFLRLVFLLLSLWGGIGLIVYLATYFRLRRNISNSSFELNAEYFWGLTLILSGLFLFFRDTFIFQYINYFQIPSVLIDALLIVFIGIIFLLMGKELFRESNIPGLSLNIKDRKLLGVCGGIAEYMNVNTNAIRMLWMIFSFATAGFGVIIYLLIYSLKYQEMEDG